MPDDSAYSQSRIAKNTLVLCFRMLITMGVTINAAYGIANQVNGAIHSFVSSFQVAFTPQIVKLYSQNRMSEFYRLCNSSAPAAVNRSSTQSRRGPESN